MRLFRPTWSLFVLGATLAAVKVGTAATPAGHDSLGQPLGANAQRLVQALEFLGSPLPPATSTGILAAARERNTGELQRLLDEFVLLQVEINPELRVKVSRGSRRAALHQNGFTPVLIKILNDGHATQRLRISSPQGGRVYAGAAALSLDRQQQPELRTNENPTGEPGRFLEVEMFAGPPMTDYLSGLEIEYALALISSTEAGQREATVAFDIGEGTGDIGFRGEAPVLFHVAPALPVKLSIRDHDGAPTVAQLTIRDAAGRVYPSQAKRLAPDFFFQAQIYRPDGAVLHLPPGRFELTFSRGPEYHVQRRTITVPVADDRAVELALQRWVEPARSGFYSGDYHIHASGCAHYQVPTQGVGPEDMFLQVKGEALNVGCILTWGYGFEHQRTFFSSSVDKLSEPLTVLKYDLEISGFGSAALGHVVLLNLKDQTYPGSAGTTRDWPTWTVPVMRWARQQGGVAGYPHSDMLVDPPGYAKRYVARQDRNADGVLDVAEATAGLLPRPFAQLDADGDGRVTAGELAEAADRTANELPNLVLPSMRGSGAMEVLVSTAEGVCDFISAMDTGRVGEWNTWYHLMNCGFPLKVGGETDFPCMSGLRVGQGRTYVKLAPGPVAKVDFAQWCHGLAEGRSYVSDGFAHALNFTVDGVEPGTGIVRRAGPGTVVIRARVAFAPEVPLGVAYGTMEVPGGKRFQGDTRVLYHPRSERTAAGGGRLVEIVRNGGVVASRTVPADGAVHELSFEVPVDRSSWIALRHFPQLHTNPVDVIVAEKPVRASRESAVWCAEAVKLLWELRSDKIAAAERPAARLAYDRAIETFQRRAAEAK